MMKKLLFVVLMGLILTSCSQEDVQLENPRDFSLSVLDNTANSSMGVYKGTFAALGSAKRGHVVITVSESAADATIVFEDNSELNLSGTGSFSSDTSVQTYRFVSELGSFDFHVNADGTEPRTSVVDIADAMGSIVLAKEFTGTPIRTSTGRYGCTECGDHPIFNDPNMQSTFVWNAVFVGDGTASSPVLIQVTFADRFFVSTGNLQNPYNKVGSFIYNDMIGEFPFGEEGMINWDATQMFSTEGICVDIIGNWDLSTSTFEYEGWLRGDDSCNPL